MRGIMLAAVVCVLAGCGKDEVWPRAIGRWSTADNDYQIRIDADGKGQEWVKRPTELRDFTWKHERIDGDTYKLTLTYGSGGTRELLAQPKTIDSLRLLNADKTSFAELAPIRESGFADPKNVLSGKWWSSDGRRRYRFESDRVSVDEFDPPRQIERKSTTYHVQNVVVTSPTTYTIELDADGAKSTWTATSETPFDFAVAGDGFSEKLEWSADGSR